MPFPNNLPPLIPIAANPMSVPIPKLSLVTFVIGIFKHSKIQLVVFKLALELIFVGEFVQTDQFLVGFPLPAETVAVLVVVGALAVAFAVF